MSPMPLTTTNCGNWQCCCMIQQQDYTLVTVLKQRAVQSPLPGQASLTTVTATAACAVAGVLQGCPGTCITRWSTRLVLSGCNCSQWVGAGPYAARGHQASAPRHSLLLLLWVQAVLAANVNGHISVCRAAAVPLALCCRAAVPNIVLQHEHYVKAKGGEPQAKLDGVA